MIRFTYDNHEYEFRGEYWKPNPDDYYLSNDLGPHARVIQPGHVGLSSRAIVYPVPVRHTFGGVVFEEVETRTPLKGEWFIHHPNEAICSDGGWWGNYPILRPVKVVNGQDD